MANRNLLIAATVAIVALATTVSLATYPYLYPSDHNPTYQSPVAIGPDMMQGGGMEENLDQPSPQMPAQNQPDFAPGMMEQESWGDAMMEDEPVQNLTVAGNQSRYGAGPGMMNDILDQNYTTVRNQTAPSSESMMPDGGMMGAAESQNYTQTSNRTQTAPAQEDAVRIAERYLASIGNPDLVIGEFEEYANNFYVSIVDRNTGQGVFEIIIDRSTGSLQREPQSRMWGTGSGMGGGMRGGGMMGGDQPGLGEMTVTVGEALRIAQDYLDEVFPGTEASDVTTYDGYYTVMITLEGEHYGMLSVNGYTGEVWYHDWHGEFIGHVEPE